MYKGNEFHFQRITTKKHDLLKLPKHTITSFNQQAIIEQKQINVNPTTYWNSFKISLVTITGIKISRLTYLLGFSVDHLCSSASSFLCDEQHRKTEPGRSTAYHAEPGSYEKPCISNKSAAGESHIVIATSHYSFPNLLTSQLDQ